MQIDVALLYGGGMVVISDALRHSLFNHTTRLVISFDAAAAG
jgi:hypothetical protein